MNSDRQDDFFERVRFAGEPIANPASVVVSDGARFTILTPRLIRLEWAEDGEFEDRGTYAFPTRYVEDPPLFRRQVVDGWLEIDTGPLQLKYRTGKGRFTPETLSIGLDLRGERVEWRPGLSDLGNLRGTRRTLDHCEAEASLEPGVLSRSGWALFDDSDSVVFNPDDGWVAPRPDRDRQDWYFFGYGHDYKAALGDYVHFGGRVPLIPRYVLGGWWSRYWAYSEQDLRDLVGEFEKQGVPLDVLVIDMDWHLPNSWTGYTWNRDLFPDPSGFLDWVHEKGLRATLNLHPAQGVQSFEEVYPEFAEAMGVEPDSEETIPFRITDKQFVKNYFQLLHHPKEEQGVDFWWMDWQQGEVSEMEGLDPLLWINHLHFRDSARGDDRPMLYSRWGGLGNHRYPIGFSGDTWVVWSALQFQPYMTATASNVCYGWWSHDIGGHMGGATEPELYARWVQFGALSPCLRLHATKDERAERRPWKYPHEVAEAAEAAFELRYRLVPYLYTLARVMADTGISPCRPMYYEFPEDDAAYIARDQYFLGDQMIVAPIVEPADPETGMAKTDVWLPEGEWIDFVTKETFTGPRWIRAVGDLERVPMFVKAGAIVPLAADLRAGPGPRLASGTTEAIPNDRLILSVFPGESGRFRLYEDDGITDAYREGEFEWTTIEAGMTSPDTWTVRIEPVEGYCPSLPRRRAYEVRFEGSREPERVTVNGAESVDWVYQPATQTTVVPIPKIDKSEPVEVTVTAAGAISALGESHSANVVQADVEQLLGQRYVAGANRDKLLEDALVATGRARADAVARLGGPFARVIEYTTPEDARRQLGRVVVGAPIDGETYDVRATFTLSRAGEKQQYVVERTGVTEPQVINTPFALGDGPTPMSWKAEVVVDWRGVTLSETHRSAPILPTIHRWHVLPYDPDEAAPRDFVDDTGEPRDGLGWLTFEQSLDSLSQNINEPFMLDLERRFREEKSLAVTTTVIASEERDVRIDLQASGEIDLTLNGERVELVSEEDAREVRMPAFYVFWPVQRSEVVHLDKGRNTLLLSLRFLTTSRPGRPKQDPWRFNGLTFRTLEGEVFTGVEFK